MDSFSLLSHIQKSLLKIKTIGEKDTNLANELADVWNSLLFSRSIVIKDLLEKEALQHTGCLRGINKILEDKLKKMPEK